MSSTTSIFSQKMEIIKSSGSTATVSQIISSIPQQTKVNIYNSTVYPTSANAVKLLPYITNNNGKVKLYTEINSNIKVGDKVFIMYNQSGSTSGVTDSYMMDSFLEFSGCTDYIYLSQLQGYNVIEINDNNNEITIDRYYDNRFVNKKIYDHYIAKIYIKNITINGGEIDGVEIANCTFNTTVDTSIDINLVQAVILSGASYYIRYKDKYDSLYISTNSTINTGLTASIYRPYIYQNAITFNQDPTPSSSYYTNNNNKYGYQYIYHTEINSCRIDNGYYEDCIIVDCNIYGGHFNNCSVFNSVIHDGLYNNTSIDTNSTWENGTWSGGTFGLVTWYNGIWVDGVFKGTWKNGVFNGGIFSGSTWYNGIFQGGDMVDSVWKNGSFNRGNIRNSIWNNGTFNGGNMQQCTWYNGTCFGGTLTNVTWATGTFNNGTFDSGFWSGGTFNNGNFFNSYWDNGTFNNGTFNSQNYAPSISNSALAPLDLSNSNISKYWRTGIFNNGVFTNSIWSGGTFYNGSFQDGSLWISGYFKYGKFIASSWIEGDFANGTVTKSYFHDVNWSNGIWNSGTLGVPLDGEFPSVNWYNGKFNSGVFGYNGSLSPKNINWYNGDFYGGTFYNEYIDCNQPGFISYGGFSGGTFHNGNFYGTFWKGVWVTGVFNGCNQSNVSTNYSPTTKIDPNKKLGDLPLIDPQRGIQNL